MRPALLFAFAPVVVPVAFAVDSEPVHNIVIKADVPVVAVAPRRPGRFALHLPSLTYVVTFTAECEEDWQPDSASISVADSRVSFGSTKLQENKTLEFELTIPSSQLAPLRVEEFCVRSESAALDQGALTIAAVLSVQASLRCAADSGQSMKYVTQPLDVKLECEVPEEASD